MSKQTAVEWLVSQLNKHGFAQVVTDEEIAQAKEMEKEQIIEAYLAGNGDAYNLEQIEPFAEDYYIEVFKGGEQ